MDLRNFIKKNWKLLAVFAVAYLVLSSPIGLQFLGVINPGFEGAKAYFYGADFRFQPTWSGTYRLHRYQDAEPILVETQWEQIRWTTTATPNDAGIGWRHIDVHTTEHPQLGIHVESNIQLEDINRQGDPINWNNTEPMDAQRIEYWRRTAVKEETANKIIYRYTAQKESFLVVPAEFWIGFYLVPSQSDGAYFSQWREGEWSNIVVWFMLDWTTWDNAYRDPWLDDPKINVFTSEYNGTILNQQKQSDYRGGFPLTAWIQGWDKAGWTSGGGDDESPTWAQVKGKENGLYTFDQLSQLKNELLAKTSFAPGLVGQFLSLYNEPSATFEYGGTIATLGTFSPEAISGKVKTPDSRMEKIMYFPINIQNFGTLTKGDILGGWTVYYPSAYFRVRTLFGVYGNFTYLWTEELAKDPAIDYPDEIERHGTTVVHTGGVLTGFFNWFSNPFNQLWLFFVLMVIVVLVVSILNPGLWGMLARRKGSEV